MSLKLLLTVLRNQKSTWTSYDHHLAIFMSSFFVNDTKMTPNVHLCAKLSELLGKGSDNLGQQISALVHRAGVVPEQTVAGIRRLSWGLFGFFLPRQVGEKKRQKIVYLLWVPYDVWLKGTPFESWPEDEHLLPRLLGSPASCWRVMSKNLL